MQGQFYSRVKLGWIQSFPSPKLVAPSRLKNSYFYKGPYVTKMPCLPSMRLFIAFNLVHQSIGLVECSPKALETRIQSQVESYQRLKKWYLIPPCLTLSIIRYVSRVKWSNPGNGVAPFPTPQCSSYWKGSFWVPLDYSRQLYLLYLYLSTLSHCYMFWCATISDLHTVELYRCMNLGGSDVTRRKKR